MTSGCVQDFGRDPCEGCEPSQGLPQQIGLRMMMVEEREPEEGVAPTIEPDNEEAGAYVAPAGDGGWGEALLEDTPRDAAVGSELAAAAAVCRSRRPG